MRKMAFFKRVLLKVKVLPPPEQELTLEQEMECTRMKYIECYIENVSLNAIKNILFQRLWNIQGHIPPGYPVTINWNITCLFDWHAKSLHANSINAFKPHAFFPKCLLTTCLFSNMPFFQLPNYRSAFFTCVSMSNSNCRTNSPYFSSFSYLKR